MKQYKTIYTNEDLIEVLAEHAIGTDVMKEIECFCQARERYTQHLRDRLRHAEQIIGSNYLDEMMAYE